MDPPSEDKQWASKYLLDPLNAPGPSEETGPGSHFFKKPTRPSSTSKGPSVTSTPANSNSHRKTTSATSYPTPPGSASPTQSSFHPSNPYSPTHRQAAFGAYNEDNPKRKSLEGKPGNGKGRRRGSSLSERFPGDMSHRPLDQLRKEAKAADRSPHLKKKHIPGADIVDTLDDAFGRAYHHEGPYDATLLARNTSFLNSPVEAVRSTNEEALRATPRENIRDALDKHVPLQGTAVIPPGMSGLDGKTMQYEEGADLMREADAPGGAYKRWDGVKYLPEDLKGKGEPSYTIEKALKENKHPVHGSQGSNSYEMQTRPGMSHQRSASGSHADMGARPSGSALRYADFEGEMRRSHTTGKKVGEGLKRRFGSLRRSKKTTEG